MSAYIVERNHIAYMVDCATSRRILGRHGHCFTWIYGNKRNELRDGDNAKAAEVAQMLWNTNHASYDYRYNERHDIDDCQVYGEHTPQMMEFVDPAQLAKACHCYAYQSCEHPQWEESEAFAFIESLKDSCLHALTGYDDAEWGPPLDYGKYKGISLSALAKR